MSKKDYIRPLSRSVDLHLESALLKSSMIEINPGESGPADAQKKRNEIWDEESKNWL